VPVNHRPRIAGVPKYGLWDRGKVGLFDCLAVRWMANRRRPVHYVAIERPPLAAPAPAPAAAPDPAATVGAADDAWGNP